MGQIILAAFAEIKRRNAGASTRESEADKEVSRIYHEIEFGTFDAAHGYALAKALQMALRGRRAAKTDRGMLKDLAVWIGNETLRRMVKRFETTEYQEATDAVD